MRAERVVLIAALAAAGCGKKPATGGQAGSAAGSGSAAAGSAGSAAAGSGSAAAGSAGSAPAGHAGSAAPASDAGAAPAARDAGAAAGADAPCTHAQVVAARHDANQKLDAGDFQGAHDRLQALLGGCYLDSGPFDAPNLDYFWVYSDLAFATYKLGAFAECRQVLGPITTPKPPDSLASHDLEDAKVGKAILYNASLCDKAYAAQHADFTAPACAVKAAAWPHAVALPASALPAGDAAACIALTDPADYDAYQKALDADDDASADTKLCPKAALLEQVKGAAGPRITELAIDEGTLADPSNCCGAQTLQVAVRGGKVLFRITGEGVRDCFGGTATVDLDTTYRLDGKRLAAVDDGSVTTH